MGAAASTRCWLATVARVQNSHGWAVRARSLARRRATASIEFQDLVRTGEINSIEGAIKMVVRGLGAAVVPRHCIQRVRQVLAWFFEMLEPAQAPRPKSSRNRAERVTGVRRREDVLSSRPA